MEAFGVPKWKRNFLVVPKWKHNVLVVPTWKHIFLVVPKWKQNVLVVATKLEGWFLNRWYATRIDISLHSQADW